MDGNNKNIKPGDLVDDGLGNIGIVVEITTKLNSSTVCYFVNFYDYQLNGWYESYDLEVISEST